MRNVSLGRVWSILAAILTIANLVPQSGATAATVNSLYRFCLHGGTNCADGKYPEAGLIMNTGGNLYGTTVEGGAYSGLLTSGGAVFELTRDATNGTWTERVLYSFCSESGCTDGRAPYAGLIIDTAGNLYGTTAEGGVYPGPLGSGGGTVFELTPDAERVLYSFCSQSGCADGQAPYAGLIMDTAGNLYGTTAEGGVYPGPSGAGGGAVFELTPDAATGTWTERVLYSFCSESGCADGQVPSAGLILDTAGNLYGTTAEGGAFPGPSGAGGGTVFELTPDAATGTRAERVLYSFCPESGCADGQAPYAGLIIDAAGNLYGTTAEGGVYPGPLGSGGGTVFELTPDAATGTWTERVLYTFCAQGGASCTDGAGPLAAIIADASGDLYGTTYNGGVDDFAGGTAFELKPGSAENGWKEKVLHSFCRHGGQSCANGAGPVAGLIMDTSGHLYGTTSAGGNHGHGAVFELP